MPTSASTQTVAAHQSRRDVLLTLSLALCAGAAGYLVVRDPVAAGALALVPTAVWLLSKRQVACVLLGASIPFVQDITGGVLGVNVAVSDLLMVLIVVSVVVEALATRRFPALRALAPINGPVLQYVVALLLLLVYHLGLGTLLATGQRLELLVFPLLIGAVIGRDSSWTWVLRAYVVGSTVLAAAWPVLAESSGAIGIQKNPAGQFMANALLILLASKEVRRRLVVTVPLLVLGLLWTQSRGAIVGAGIGLIVLLIVQPHQSRRRLTLQLVPLTLLTLTAFALLPEAAQDRNTSFEVGIETRAGYALKIREGYREDAWDVIRAHPWSGIGVGQYAGGNQALGSSTDDPHHVLLLQAAEGGYLFAISFLVLAGGALWTVMRRAKRTSMAPAAVAVSTSIIAHGMVDVYWVRGTPLMGWILVGLALAQRGRSDQDAPRPVTGRLP